MIGHVQRRGRWPMADDDPRRQERREGEPEDRRQEGERHEQQERLGRIEDRPGRFGERPGELPCRVEVAACKPTTRRVHVEPVIVPDHAGHVREHDREIGGGQHGQQARSNQEPVSPDPLAHRML
jgi:hypothetical protein